MKRILSALAAAASIAALTLGAAGTATAAEKAAQQAPPVYISEIATRGPGLGGEFQKYIEIANPSFERVNIGGLQLQATFGQQLVTIAIPMGTVLGPKAVYTIAHARFTGCVPDQVFTENLPSTRPVQLLLGTPGGARVDVATAPPHPARLARSSLHRIAFTGSPTDFAPGPRTPCVFDATAPSAQ